MGSSPATTAERLRPTPEKIGRVDAILRMGREANRIAPPIAGWPEPTAGNRQSVGCYWRPDDRAHCWCGYPLPEGAEFGTCPECSNHG